MPPSFFMLKLYRIPLGNQDGIFSGRRLVPIETVFLWLRLINLVDHLLQIVVTLFLSFKIAAANDVPALNDVDAIVVVVAIQAAATVDANAEVPAEEVGDDLAEAGPAIVVLIWRTKPTAFAVG